MAHILPATRLPTLHILIITDSSRRLRHAGLRPNQRSISLLCRVSGWLRGLRLLIERGVESENPTSARSEARESGEMEVTADHFQSSVMTVTFFAS
jgi:hypothetical protein